MFFICVSAVSHVKISFPHLPVLNIMMIKFNPCYHESDSKCVCVCCDVVSQDYWFSLVFKRLVGPRVLAVRVAGLQRKPQPGRVIRDKLRIYAHCTSYYKYVRQLRHLGLVCNLHLKG